jgi:plastocyanin
MNVWKRARPVVTVAQVIGFCGAIAGCGGDTPITDPGAPPTPVTSAEVFADPSIVFSPAAVTIVAGGTVVFDFGPIAHNVFFDNQPPGAPGNISGNNANTSKTLTFTTAGTFVYNCHIHPGMRGTVTVK